MALTKWLVTVYPIWGYLLKTGLTNTCCPVKVLELPPPFIFQFSAALLSVSHPFCCISFLQFPCSQIILKLLCLPGYTWAQCCLAVAVLAATRVGWGREMLGIDKPCAIHQMAVKNSLSQLDFHHERGYSFPPSVSSSFKEVKTLCLWKCGRTLSKIQQLK